MSQDLERKLLVAVQDGLPLVEEPYRVVAEAVGATEQQVIDTLQKMLESGKVRRIGAVPNHWVLGVNANGLAVWDVPDPLASDAGRRLGQQPEVSHCYLRARHLPEWPYNLFAMTHGGSREEVLTALDRINRELGLESYPHEVLFSTRMRKKTGVRLASRSV